METKDANSAFNWSPRIELTNSTLLTSWLNNNGWRVSGDFVFNFVCLCWEFLLFLLSWVEMTLYLFAALSRCFFANYEDVSNWLEGLSSCRDLRSYLAFVASEHIVKVAASVKTGQTCDDLANVERRTCNLVEVEGSVVSFESLA